MGYTKEEIKAERIRRANLKTRAVDESMSQQKQSVPMPQQEFQENPFMSGVTGFNTAFSRPAKGLMQLVTGNNWEGLRKAADIDEADYARSMAVNPISTTLGNVTGEIALGMPLGAPFAKLATKVAPIVKNSPYLKNILEGVLAGGALGGAQYTQPDESRGANVLKGAGTGGGVSAALPGLWRGASMAGQGISKAIGHPGSMMKEFLSKFTPEEMTLALDKAGAAKRIGGKMTPAEAAENKIASKFEGKLGTSPEGERALYEFKKSQKGSEEESIENLFDIINPKSENAFEKIRQMARKIVDKREKALQAKARPYYEATENIEIPTDKLNGLLKDGNIKLALKDVLTDERYAKEIEGFSPNSIKVLDETKKRLDGEIGTAKRSGDKNLARILRNSKQELVDILDYVAPDYKKARDVYSDDSPLVDLLRKREIGKIANLKDDQIKKVANIVFDPGQVDNKELARLATEFNKENPEAWSRLIRNYMENKTATKYEGRTGYHGTNFYNQFLADSKTFDKLQTALSHNPEAQSILKDMRTVFKDIQNQPTIKGTHALAKSSLDVPRSTWQALKTFAGNVTGGYYDQAMIDIITTDKWQKAFEKALKEPNKESKMLKIRDVLDSAMGGAGKAAAQHATQTEGPFAEYEN